MKSFFKHIFFPGALFNVNPVQVKLLVFSFLFLVFCGSTSLQSFGQCGTCTVTDPPAGPLTVAPNTTVCFTVNKVLGDVTIGNGGRLCISPGVLVTIETNVITAGDVFIESGGTLQCNQQLNITGNLNLTIKSGGTFQVGSNGNSTFNMHGSGRNLIYNGGTLKASVLSFTNASSQNLVENDGVMQVGSDFNLSGTSVVRNHGTLLINDPSITFLSDFAFKANASSTFINCGLTNVYNGINLGGGTFFNSEKVNIVTGSFDLGGAADIENYGVFTVSNGTFNSNYSNTVFHNAGLARIYGFQGSGTFSGPATGEGKTGYFEITGPNRITLNSAVIGPHVDWTFTSGTTMDGDGRPVSTKPGTGENGTNINSNRQWVFQNLNGTYDQVETASFDCRTAGNCAFAIDTTYNCVVSDGILPPGSPAAIFGKLFNDVNGLTDGEINDGTVYSTPNIYINLVEGSNNTVMKSLLVAPDGSFGFYPADNVVYAHTYKVILTSSQTAVGATLTGSTLPPGLISTGEDCCDASGTDGVPDGSLIFNTVETIQDNLNFGVQTFACTEYRTVSSGLFDNAGIWEKRLNPSDAWAPAPEAPVSGAAVYIRHNVTLATDFTVQNCPFNLEDNGASRLIINPKVTLNFNGGTDGNAYFNGRPVVVTSTAAGTGAIGAMLSNSKTNGDNNVTVERYIPGAKRRWNLLSFGVTSTTATIQDAWAGGSRARVANSQNNVDGVPLGTPPAPWNPKPPNKPYDAGTGGLPADYVAGDGTIITGHRHSVASTANGQGYDWWPELIIPAGATWWESPTRSIVVGVLQTTPSSIRPYIPGKPSDFGPDRGVDWVSTPDINTGFGGAGLVKMKLADAFNQYQAFMLYTRGDRQVLENWFNATTLRPTGQINTLTKTVAIHPKATQNLTVVGNPYPAPVDFDKVYDLVANQAVIEPYFHIWDSNLPGTSGNGAWRVVFRVADNNWTSTLVGGGSPITSSANPQFVSSSQGLLIEGTSAGGNLTFNENMKAEITQLQIIPFDEPAGDEPKPGLLFADLNTRSASTGDLSAIDGVAIVVGKAYSADLTDKIDIRKVNSFTGDLALSIKRNSQILMVEAYPDPKEEAIFPLETRGLTERGYAFTFNVDNLYLDGREAYLKDKFLNTLTPISTFQKTRYNFDGTPVAGSVSASRFEIVLKGSTILPVTFTYVNAVEQRGDVKVSWGTATEKNLNHYEVEHSLNGVDFGKAFNVAAKNASPSDYSWLHVQPGTGNHFYRVRAVDNDGRSMLTRIMKVTIGGDKPGFKVFPTVVSNTADVTLQLISLEKGKYNLQVVDMSGRVIQSQAIQHNGGSASMILKIPASLSAGKYSIRLNNGGLNFVESVIKNR